MRISELADATGVPIATLKYYLRQGLVPPGVATSRTQATYDQSHVDRVRLIRALGEVGGLSLATIARLLTAIDQPTPHLDVLAAAQRALLGPDVVDQPDGPAEPPAARDPGPIGTRAQQFVRDRGWRVDPGDPVLDVLERAWEACDAAGIGLDAERLGRYADAAELVAAVDVGTVPDAPDQAVRQVVLGTVLVDPVLAALRRLAQQDLSTRRFHTGDDTAGPGDDPWVRAEANRLDDGERGSLPRGGTLEA